MLGIEMFVHGTASIAYVIGPVADEGVYIVLYRFEEGLISKEQAMEQLRAARLDGQVLFYTDKSLECLRFIGYREVE